MELAVGQVWVGRNHGSLLKILDFDAYVVWVKLLATNNPQISHRVGMTNWVLVEHLQADAIYPGDLV